MVGVSVPGVGAGEGASDAGRKMVDAFGRAVPRAVVSRAVVALGWEMEFWPVMTVPLARPAEM